MDKAVANENKCAVLQYTHSLTPIQYACTIQVVIIVMQHFWQIPHQLFIYRDKCTPCSVITCKCSLRLAALYLTEVTSFLFYCIYDFVLHFNLHDFHHTWRWTDYICTNTLFSQNNYVKFLCSDITTEEVKIRSFYRWLFLNHTSCSRFISYMTYIMYRYLCFRYKHCIHVTQWHY